MPHNKLLNQRNYDYANRVAVTEGFQYLGQGAHGICYNGVNGQVIKLHNTADQAYIRFIKWVYSLDRVEAFMRHLPEIYAIYYEKDYVVVIMERLYNIAQKDAAWGDPDVEDALSIDGMAHLTKLGRQYKQDIHLLNAPLASLEGRLNQLNTLELCMVNIVASACTPYTAFDLTTHNILLRITGGGYVPVFTDPIC